MTNDIRQYSYATDSPRPQLVHGGKLAKQLLDREAGQLANRTLKAQTIYQGTSLTPTTLIASACYENDGTKQPFANT